MPRDRSASPEEIAGLRALYKEILELQWKLTSSPAASTSFAAAMLCYNTIESAVSKFSLTLQEQNLDNQATELIIRIITVINSYLVWAEFGYGFIKLRKIFLKYMPNSIFTTNQQIPRCISKLRSGDQLSSKDISTLTKELTICHKQFSTRANYPFWLILLSFGLSCFLHKQVWPLIQDSDYTLPYTLLDKSLHLAGVVGPIVGWILDAIGNCYRNWNRTNREEKAKQQFQDHFSPKGKFTWQVAGNKPIQTKILYTTYTGKNKIKIQLPDCTIEIPAKKYFLELAKILVQMELNFLLVTKDGIYIGLEETLGLVMEKAQETLYQRLRDYKQQQTILRQLNSQFSIYAQEWHHVEQDNESLFYISRNKAPDNFLSVLQTQYSDVEIIERVNSKTFVIKNPKLKAHAPAGSSSSFDKMEQENYYPHPAALPIKGPGKSKKRQETKPTTREKTSKPKIFVTFPRVHLQFDSATYIEATALMRPMFAAWLPDYCHFSYLDPRMSIYLPGDLNLSQVLGILKSGQTFPSGILKGKSGHVGICVANEPYTNIHGQTFISDYKIKTTGYRLHGRLYDTATDGRRRVYIFDGIRKHGH